MSHEKKGIVIISVCFIILFSMFLIQLPNNENISNNGISNISEEVKSMYNEPYNGTQHFTNYNTTSYLFINSTNYTGYGGSGGYGNFVQIQNVSSSPVNATFYVVGGGGYSGSPRMITN
jgi:hypothetical protein